MSIAEPVSSAPDASMLTDRSLSTLSSPAVMSPRLNTRSQMLDACRAIAGMAIVWCHVATTFNDPGADTSWIVGTFGVPFYLFVALYFVATGLLRDRSRALGPYLIGRVKKLYLPFLVWTFAYAALTYVKNRHEGWHFPANYFWTGSYTHLYFLPLLLACTVVLSLIVRPAARSTPLRLGMIALLIGAALAIGFIDVPQSLVTVDDRDYITATTRNYLRAAPPALAAIAFALHFGRSARRLVVPASVAIAGMVTTVACVVGQMIGKPTMLARALSGMGWTLLAFGPWQALALRPLAVIGRHSFGIYLCHVAFIRAADAVITRFSIPRDYVPMQAGVFVVSFVGALVLSACLARWRATEWIVGYEGEKIRKTMGS
jgi:peptidoglycan/LPS O-acetylase OafA/YrhL